MKRHESVDDYIANSDNWQVELKRLREILNSTALVEEVKLVRFSSTPRKERRRRCDNGV